MKSALVTVFVLFFIMSSSNISAQTYEIESVIPGLKLSEYSNSSRDYYEELIDAISKFTTITIREGDLAIVSMTKSDWKLLFRFYKNANMLRMSDEDYSNVNEFYCTSDIINGINYLEMSVKRVSGKISSGEIKCYPEKGLYKPIFIVKFLSQSNPNRQNIATVQIEKSDKSKQINAHELPEMPLPVEIDSIKLAQITKKVDGHLLALRKELEKQYSDEITKEEIIEFIIDTCRIERIYSEKTNIDYSTLGMKESLADLDIQYDNLLNKYYKKLISKLPDSDKEILKQAQRNWIKFRDSENELINLLSGEKYSGGGTMQGFYSGERSLYFTKKRVGDLFQYFIELDESDKIDKLIKDLTEKETEKK